LFHEFPKVILMELLTLLPVCIYLLDIFYELFYMNFCCVLFSYIVGYILFGFVFLMSHLVSSLMNMAKLSQLAKICYMCIKVSRKINLFVNFLKVLWTFFIFLWTFWIFYELFLNFFELFEYFTNFWMFYELFEGFMNLFLFFMNFLNILRTFESFMNFLNVLWNFWMFYELFDFYELFEYFMNFLIFLNFFVFYELFESFIQGVLTIRTHKKVSKRTYTKFFACFFGF